MTGGWRSKHARLAGLAATFCLALSAVLGDAAAAPPAWLSNNCELTTTQSNFDTEAVVSDLARRAKDSQLLQVALVVGNQKYEDTRLILNSPSLDAVSFCRMLASSGFFVRHSANLNSRSFHIEVNRLVSIVDLTRRELAKLYPNDQKKIVVYFYFSGHGFGWNNENYLLPVDIPYQTPILEATDRSVSVDYLIGKLRPSSEPEGRGRVGIYLVIDACRNIPRGYFVMPETKAALDGTWFYRQAVNFGGMYAFFATGAGNYARDGEVAGRRSAFTEAFVEVMSDAKYAKLGPFDFFTEVSNRTRRMTRYTQHPEFYGMAGEGNTAPVPGFQQTAVEVTTAPSLKGWIFAGNQLKGTESLSDLNVRSTDKSKRVERASDLVPGATYVLTDAVRVREQRPKVSLCTSKSPPSGNYGECVAQVGLARAGNTVKVLQPPESERLATRDQFWLLVEVTK